MGENKWNLAITLSHLFEIYWQHSEVPVKGLAPTGRRMVLSVLGEWSGGGDMWRMICIKDGTFGVFGLQLPEFA